MKKLLMGLAALSTLSFVTPVLAEEAPAGDKPAKEHKGKKHKAEKPAEKPAEAAPAK